MGRLWLGVFLVARVVWGGAVAVSPPRFDIELTGPSATEAFKVVNLGEHPVRFQVSVAHFALDENNRLQVIAPSPQSADQWLVVTPLTFTVDPGKAQSVRFAVRPRVKPEPGEHRAMIFLQELPPENKPFAMLNLAKIGVGVYVNVPPVERKARLHCVDFRWLGDALWAALDIESLGNAHVRPQGHFVVWPQALYPGRPGTAPVQETFGGPVKVPEGAVLAGLIPDVPILPGTRRTLRFPLGSVEAGEYVVELVGQVQGEEFAWALPMTVPKKQK